MFNYPLAFNDFTNQDAESIKELFNNGQLTQGEITKKYEENLASYFGSKYAVAVNSGSSANLLMLASLLYSNEKGNILKRGDEVIVPAVSWLTTYSPILQLGMVPKVVDVGAYSLNICIDSIEKAITDKTKCIFAVNLLGLPCELDKIKNICEKYNLILIEDNCESMGAKYRNKFSGTYGLMSSQSTYMSHHISTIEGGFVLTNNFYFNDLLRSLRSHGWARNADINSTFYKENTENYEGSNLPDDFLFFLPGFNLRTTEINSLLGLRKLNELDEIIKKRQYLSKEFRKIIDKSNLEIYTQKYDAHSSCFGFPIICKDLNLLERLKKSLDIHGFQTRPIVTGNIMRHPVSRFFPSLEESLPNADKIHNNGLYIGNYFSSIEDAIIDFSKAINSLRL